MQTASSAIRDIEYDPDERRLTVTFITGRIYEYFDVPVGIVGCFEDAESKGAFFNRHIRDHYDFREITSAA
jgi:hypothetical protein